jgi:adenylate kinase
MSLNFFIIGPSGSGKSTQAKLIAEKYGLTHFSMGQLLRDEVAARSSLSLEIKKSQDAGIPTPDDIALPVLSQKLASINNQNFIIDGFPRVLNQGHYIDKYLVDKGQPASLLIHLKVDFLEILKRRQAKGEDFQDSSRSDNTPEAIANRQKILYETDIAAILDYYRQQNKLFEVDGSRPVEPIFEDIVKKIDRIK